MKVELFTNIVHTLEGRIAECKQYLAGIDTTDDIRALTIAQGQELRNFCRKEEPMMTKLAQTDLYHIIGMGNLSPVQMMKFTYLVRDYLQYRSTVKTLAFHFDKISALPGLPVSATYKAHCFEGLTLCANVGFPEMPDCTDTLPYSVYDRVITVSQDRVVEFVKLWAKLANNNFSLNNLQSKARAGSEYGSIKWSMDEWGNFVGIPKSKDTVLETYYKNTHNMA